MKHSYNFLLAMILLIMGSCTSSQYSVSRRSVKNGHVAYINTHKHDRLKLVHKTKANPQSIQEKIPVTADGIADDHRIEYISRMAQVVPVALNEQLIASTEIVTVRIHSKRFIEQNLTQVRKPSVQNQFPSTDRLFERDSLKDSTLSKSKAAESSVAQNRKVEGFGLTGFITSIVGLFIAGIPLGIFSIVFGIVGVSRASSHPEKRKGKGFGIAAIIIGVVALVGAIIVLGM